MATLRVERLSKHFGGAPAVDDVSFTVEPGEFLSLLGPSGCGKTTTLRCIAGFERPDSGRILIDEEPITDIEAGVFTPPNRRGFGMVFQSYAVWPHMTVLENVSYPLTVRGAGAAGRPGRSQARERALAKLELVGLAGLDARFPNQLSGGQQQRVALARALVMEPRLLLFDEPLSNLDAKLRERMRFELMELQGSLGIPAVYVTHDQAEAMVISRRILVMQRGRIAQVGPPREIYEHPRTRFVADFIGLTNFLPAEVLAGAGAGRWRVRSALGEHPCTSAREHAAGDAVVLAIRPERVNLQMPAREDAHVFETRLRNAYFLGPYTEYFLDTGGTTLRAEHGEAIAASAGETLRAWVAVEHCLVVEDDVDDGPHLRR